MQQPISITGISSLSAIGSSTKHVWEQLQHTHAAISRKIYNGVDTPIGAIPSELKQEIEDLRQSNLKYKSLDDTVLFAIYVSRKAITQAEWADDTDFGINIGSSRGATQLFEQHYDYFSKKGKTRTLSSPTTTLGNISSWVAQDLQCNGPEISHSITCSSALHAVLNGVAWLHSGMVNKFMVGGSEASLTPFTIAQMKALKVYSKREDNFPCQAMNMAKTENTMVLGEGAAMACLEYGKKPNALAMIEGIGYATELLEHNASLSANATCMQKAMRMAIKDINPSDVDIIVTHTPGTIKGDSAELNAINKVFGADKPAITCNKWKIGHTFATSGMLSLEMAVLMLQHQEFITVPYLTDQKTPKHIEKILVNAVGFGGNAVSVLLSKA